MSDSMLERGDNWIEKQWAETDPRKRGELLAEIKHLRKALEFYADISKYPAPFTGGMGDLWSDCGQIARAALSETRKP